MPRKTRHDQGNERLTTAREAVLAAMVCDPKHFERVQRLYKSPLLVDEGIELQPAAK